MYLSKRRDDYYMATFGASVLSCQYVSINLGKAVFAPPPLGIRPDLIWLIIIISPTSGLVGMANGRGGGGGEGGGGGG